MAFDPVPIALSVVGANASVAMLVILGIVATYAGIWDKQGISDLGKLVFNMSMPALVFSKVLNQVSVESLLNLWVLPVFCVLHVLSAYFIMSLLNKLAGLEGSEAKATLACIMFGNCGSLAIAVVQSLCQGDPLMSAMGGQANCTAVGVSYCAFYVIAWNILVWGLGDALLFPDEDDEKVNDQALVKAKPADASGAAWQAHYKVDVEKKGQATMPKGVTEPLLKAQSAGNPTLDRHWSEPSAESPTEALAPTQSDLVAQNRKFKATSLRIRDKSKLAQRVRQRAHTFHDRTNNRVVELEVTEEALNEIVSRMPVTGGLYVEKLKDDLRERSQPDHILVSEESKPSLVRQWLDKAKKTCIQLQKSPPIRAAGAAVLLGIFPPIKALFVGEGAPLGFVLVAMNQMGNAQVPVSMVMLSGSGTLRYLENLQKQAKEECQKNLGGDTKLEMESFSFSKTATVFMLFGRLLIMPFVGYLWWWLFVSILEWWPAASGSEKAFSYGGGMLGFICLIEACVPSAQTIVTMFIVHGDVAQGGAIAMLILAQYALSVVFFSIAAAYFEFVTL